jgi:hypothetical protein
MSVVEDDDLRVKTIGIVVHWSGREPGELRIDTAVGAIGIYR